GGCGPVFGALQKRALAFVVQGDPAGPIDLVEEPVHDDEEDDDGEESGGGLDVERVDALGQVVHDTDGDEPGEEGGESGDADAGGHRAPIGLTGLDHAGGDGGENQDALQPLAEDEDGDVQDPGEGAALISQGIGIAGGGDALP